MNLYKCVTEGRCKTTQQKTGTVGPSLIQGGSIFLSDGYCAGTLYSLFPCAVLMFTCGSFAFSTLHLLYLYALCLSCSVSKHHQTHIFPVVFLKINTEHLAKQGCDDVTSRCLQGLACFAITDQGTSHLRLIHIYLKHKSVLQTHQARLYTSDISAFQRTPLSALSYYSEF